MFNETALDGITRKADSSREFDAQTVRYVGISLRGLFKQPIATICYDEITADGPYGFPLGKRSYKRLSHATLQRRIAGIVKKYGKDMPEPGTGDFWRAYAHTTPGTTGRGEGGEGDLADYIVARKTLAAYRDAEEGFKRISAGKAERKPVVA